MEIKTLTQDEIYNIYINWGMVLNSQKARCQKPLLSKMLEYFKLV